MARISGKHVFWSFAAGPARAKNLDLVVRISVARVGAYSLSLSYSCFGGWGWGWGEERRMWWIRRRMAVRYMDAWVFMERVSSGV